MTFPRLTTTALVAGVLATGAAQAQDALEWSGFYAGVADNIIAPEIDSPVPSGTPLREGTGFGVFGGYNYALTDRFVVGGELSYNFQTLFEVAPGVDATMDNAAVARVRGGYAVGNVLLYGTAGYNMVEFTPPGGGASFSADGVIYGIGLEAMLIENFSFRIDYTSTHLNPDPGPLPAGSQIDANSVTLGLAFHF